MLNVSHATIPIFVNPERTFTLLSSMNGTSTHPHKIISSPPVVFVYNTNTIQIQNNKNNIFPTCCLCLLLNPLSNRVLRLFLLLQFFFEICWKYSNKYSAENILQVYYVNIVVDVFGNGLVLNNLPCPTAASRNGWLLEAVRI